MIRRFYILPIRPTASAAEVHEFVSALNRADEFIPGLVDSSAAVDLDSRTVLWENTFVDEASYSGPYLVHPYHVSTIDSYVMMDSPECLTSDIYTTRFELPDDAPRLDHGVRRLVLMNLADGADTAGIDALAVDPDGMTTSELHPDDVGFMSYKGRSWTHVWEQGFADMSSLERYLRTREGVACSSLEGIKRLGVQIEALRVLTCPFQLKPARAAQRTATTPVEDPAAFYTITARTALDDADTYIDLCRRYYDPYVVDAGGELLHRWRTVDSGYHEAEIHSTWQVESVSAYREMRGLTPTHAGWNIFVRDAMPLVLGGTRRFYRAV